MNETELNKNDQITTNAYKTSILDQLKCNEGLKQEYMFEKLEKYET